MIWFLIIGCAHRTVDSDSVSNPEPDTLVIAHTNDLHTYYEPTLVIEEGEEQFWGGFERIDGLLAELRAEHGEEDVLYLDGGDLLTGTPLMEFRHRGVQGGAMLDLLEATGCDAMVLGNHEFDRGIENVAALVAASEIPMLSSNLVLEADPSEPAVPGLLPHVVLEAAGQRVGVFGLTTGELAEVINPEILEGIVVRDPVEVAREQVAILAPRVDVIIALTHIGLSADREVAAGAPGIDLIVGGHSHTAMEAAELVGDTWIVQAGQYARNLGIAELELGSEASWDWERVDLSELRGQPSGAVSDLVEAWDHRVDERFEMVIGTLEATLDREGDGQTSMGRWGSDLVRHASGADVGIYNRGGLREDLAMGEVTLLDLYRVFPFGNDVVSFDWTGAQLRRVVEANLGSELDVDPALLQWSGIRYHWALVNGEPRLQELWVGEEPVMAEETYSIGTNVFVAWQWESQLGEAPASEVNHHGLTVFEAAEAAFAHGPVSVPADLRSIRMPQP